MGLSRRPSLDVHNTENGNALFLILIAVALFAALSYAVTQSGRGSGSVSKETLSLDISRFISYTGLVEGAVNRLMIVNNCADSQLSFHYDSDGDGSLETNGEDYYYNASSPTDYSCYVFHPGGGGLTYQDPPAGMGLSNDVRFVGTIPVDGLKNGGSTGDLLIGHRNVTREACIYVNNKFGVTNPSGAPPVTGFTWPFIDTRFTGSFVVAGAHINFPNISGNPTGCFHDNVGNVYYFYHVLIDR